MPKLFIGPYKEGLQRNLEPWLLPQDAFPILEDAYVWRGRVKKKEGYGFVGRLHREAPTLPDALGSTVGVGNTFSGTIAAANLPISPGTVTITVGALTFTDFQAAASGRPNPIFNGIGTLSTNTVNSNYGTIDYNTGAVSLNFDPALGAGVAVAVSSAQRVERIPVMGIGTYEQTDINREGVIVFDQTYAYDYNSGTSQFRDISFYATPLPRTPVTWNSTDSDFFWTTNYYNVFWETNNIEGNHGRSITNISNALNAIITVGAGHTFIAGDEIFINEVAGMTQINGLTGVISAITPTTVTVNIDSTAFGGYTSGGVAFAITRTISGDGIRYYDGFGAGLGWRNFSPPLQSTSSPNYLTAALIILSFKDRLIALNTTERPFLGGGGTHRQRARWSQNGTPFYNTSNTFAAGVPNPGYSWTEDVGRGGYIDAPTNEAIVSAAYVKDSLIVFFERSTWQLRYSGNEVLPFYWERINEELGAESTFSPVQFDKGILAIGDKAIITANTINVDRIDQKIPDAVFNFHNDNEGVKRIQGIRDFYKKIVYWTFPNDDDNATFPDKMLALNYDEGSYALFNNSFTSFGTMQFSTDYTWATLPYDSWSDWNIPWGSPVSQSYFPDVIAGNQRGFILNLSTDRVENAISMDLNTTIGIPNSISNTTPAVCQITNHNLRTGQFVKITNTRGFAVSITGESIGTAPLSTTSFTGTLSNIGIFPATVVVTIGANIFVDLGDGTMSGGTGNSTIDYENATFTVNFTALGADTPVTANYDYNILNFRNFFVQKLTDNTFSIFTIDQATGNRIPVPLSSFISPYTGSGQVSVIDNFRLATKRFSPFLEGDEKFRLSYFDAFLKTSGGDFIVNVYAEQDLSAPINTLVGSSVNYTGKNSEKHWTRFFANVDSNFLALEFTMSDYQMTVTSNPSENFELHAINLDIQGAGRL